MVHFYVISKNFMWFPKILCDFQNFRNSFVKQNLKQTIHSRIRIWMFWKVGSGSSFKKVWICNTALYYVNWMVRTLLILSFWRLSQSSVFDPFLGMFCTWRYSRMQAWKDLYYTVNTLYCTVNTLYCTVNPNNNVLLTFYGLVNMKMKHVYTLSLSQMWILKGLNDKIICTWTPNIFQ